MKLRRTKNGAIFGPPGTCAPPPTLLAKHASFSRCHSVSPRVSVCVLSVCPQKTENKLLIRNMIDVTRYEYLLFSALKVITF